MKPPVDSADRVGPRDASRRKRRRRGLGQASAAEPVLDLPVELAVDALLRPREVRDCDHFARAVVDGELELGAGPVSACETANGTSVSPTDWLSPVQQAQGHFEMQRLRPALHCLLGDPELFQRGETLRAASSRRRPWPDSVPRRVSPSIVLSVSNVTEPALRACARREIASAPLVVDHACFEAGRPVVEPCDVDAFQRCVPREGTRIAARADTCESATSPRDQVLAGMRPGQMTLGLRHGLSRGVPCSRPPGGCVRSGLAFTH